MKQSVDVVWSVWIIDTPFVCQCVSLCQCVKYPFSPFLYKYTFGVCKYTYPFLYINEYIYLYK